MEVKKSNHCAYQTHYHVVFPVKYRKALLSDEITQRIKAIANEISERYEIEFEQLGCDEDHIHILCSFHPKYSVSGFVKKFKSITARQLFLSFPKLRKELWGGEFWSDGYYVATVGERGDWSVVEKYVKEQGKSADQLTLF
ncbi:MAG: IS200/IS605 family transposase [Gammaproteobacteria bacterium]|jgi:putative transposase